MLNFEEMTHDDVINETRNCVSRISLLLAKTDPYAAMSILSQMTEIETQIMGLIYGSLLDQAEIYEAYPYLPDLAC